MAGTFLYNEKDLSKLIGLFGAGSGNRTRIASLEGWNSTIELHLHLFLRTIIIINNSILIVNTFFNFLNYFFAACYNSLLISFMQDFYLP